MTFKQKPQFDMNHCSRLAALHKPQRLRSFIIKVLKENIYRRNNWAKLPKWVNIPPGTLPLKLPRKREPVKVMRTWTRLFK